MTETVSILADQSIDISDKGEQCSDSTASNVIRFFFVNVDEESDKSTPASELKSEVPQSEEFTPGDLLWVKESSRQPFWPSIIVKEPVSREHKFKEGSEIEYYVMYFGTTNYFGWTGPSERRIPFHGKRQFHDEELISEKKNTEKDESFKRRKRSLELAVREAQSLLPLTNQARLQRLKRLKKLQHGDLFVSVCSSCLVGDDDALVVCECGNSFHPNCTPYPRGDRCEQCSFSGCFICRRKTKKGLQYAKCCRRYFHSFCIVNFKLNADFCTEQDALELCPSDFCFSCGRRLFFKRGGRKLSCTFCPAVYCLEERCLPALSRFLTSYKIICPKHIRTAGKHESVLSCCSVCWVADPEHSEQLILCSKCCRAFHRRCWRSADTQSDLEGRLCEFCRLWMFPVYGDFCFGKLSSGQLWPVQMIHPNQAKACPPSLKLQTVLAVKVVGSQRSIWIPRFSLHPFSSESIQHVESSDSVVKSECFRKALGTAKSSFLGQKRQKEQIAKSRRT